MGKTKQIRMLTTFRGMKNKHVDIIHCKKKDTEGLLVGHKCNTHQKEKAGYIKICMNMDKH